VSYGGLAPACPHCPIPVGGSSLGVEEHVVTGPRSGVVERGVVYGSVRVLAAGSTGRADLRLEASLDSDGRTVSGTVSNTGRARVEPVLVYTYSQGAYRAAPVAPFLDPGEAVTFSSGLSPVPEAVGAFAAALTPAQQAGLLADEVGRRTLGHRGQLALVGFVSPLATSIGVDGVKPRRRILTAFGLPTETRSAPRNLGDLTDVRLAAATAQPDGTLRNTYDITCPPTSAPIRLRVDDRLYGEVEVYDWGAHAWRPGRLQEDPRATLVSQTPLAPSEIANGLVRVRVREAGVGWGADLNLRFMDEVP
jgi:hypothetical protein